MKHLKLLLILAFIGWGCPDYAWAQLYDLVVAKDGSGDYTCIQDAVNAVRDYKPEGRQRILVKKGVYEEKLIIYANKTNVSLIGEDRDSTILVWHDHGNTIDAAGRKIGTFRTHTLRVDGHGFECENMTISNDAMTHYNPGWWQRRENRAGVAQAVAVHIEGDRAVFRNCRLLGFQDTLFNGNENSRQMFYRCYIEGTVDFIFGPATVWFEECHIHAISQGYLTAASTPGHHPYGYVFNRCRITTDPSIKSEWLGRPWRNYAYTLFKECELPASIHPKGWNNWSDPSREKTARYLEYKCYGEGARPSERANWTRQLTDEEAALVTMERVLHHAADTWATNALPLTLRQVAKPLIGKPYRAATLETEANIAKAAIDMKAVEEMKAKAAAEKKKLNTPLPSDVEELVVNLDGMDCTTLVEYITASLLGRVLPTNAQDTILTRFVQALRYEGGKRGNYPTRHHYFSQWIAGGEAQGILHEITATLPHAKAQRKTINFMSQHADLYPQLKANTDYVAAIRERESTLSERTTHYIPTARISAVMSQLQEGDIVAWVSKTKGLDIAHVGFVYLVEGTPCLLHASSKEGKVVIGEPLDQYAKTRKDCLGMRVVRIVTE